jgi:glycosyltransferase involved in cell wall biosynthesis
MPPDNPLVSIVIPVYNGARYLGEAIDSALAQTYSPCEIVVVNDGSTDNGATGAVAQKYGDRIRYFSKPNGGVASALNFGIKAMKGRYFSWLSHDDVYYPWKIKCQMDIMRKARRVFVLYGGYDIIDENSNFIQKEVLDRVPPSRFRISLIAASPVNGCTCLIPKACFDTAGLFDESLKTTQDNDLWFRMSETYGFVQMRKSLIKSRIHSRQGSLVIVTHTDEKTAYYVNCIDRLRKTTLPQDRPLVFARLALVLKVYGNALYEKAVSIAQEKTDRCPRHVRFAATMLLWYCSRVRRRYLWGYVLLALKNKFFRKRITLYYIAAKRQAESAASLESVS